MRPPTIATWALFDPALSVPFCLMTPLTKLFIASADKIILFASIEAARLFLIKVSIVAAVVVMLLKC